MKDFLKNLLATTFLKRPKVITTFNTTMPFVVDIVNAYEDTDTDENMQIDLVVDGEVKLSILTKVLKISRYRPFFTYKE